MSLRRESGRDQKEIKGESDLIAERYTVGAIR
jgi:hypothetical protein